ncbi:hypothetical protein EHI8A_011450 [Entamoeba histolytica HM-1:IMSS-B]|uniref:VWFA domain-containing protein n=6 Tax=Entamoeba histolytica TaxID=5759 RepID=C4LTL0_ENTH1|nr:hypothetical protein EHI_012170 [Entamoeba histolytica HM-1:IMSS]EMD43248.1 Hypothetical protein EHI5A_020600 [Entamoeba histolytica KU27]EMH76342.1 hypothetical protein EHI8A_011450 [Entamoeba histolytica HM-1:IMSS-B]EMS13183.1 hypothetical protein KM1_030340 [Entamoeba histolytica HM-3:IMSS]ENY61613.1 hypothetical protein EHI7A_037460 [Entamoeba histolytica HM-1:IMSS-A]GAT91903.1 hypothetical protein CL6EHI_012170 [Entamoeba histolytica]|eukprot:XP_656191.1 hypothetical protein EHI_012170 [Entamoeba histolytica HM-1:IMSS]
MEASEKELAKTTIKKGFKFSFSFDPENLKQPTSEGKINYCSCGAVLTSSPCPFCGKTSSSVTPLKNGFGLFKLTSGKQTTDIKTHVYCIDISGSMEGNRIYSIQSTIKKKIQELVLSRPQDKVAIVLFESDCFIIGDGMSDIVQIDSDLSIDAIEKKVKSYPTIHPISESLSSLMKKIDSINTNGRTASISGLWISILLAIRTGGDVLFCTDGMQNKGLGTDNVNKIIQVLQSQHGSTVVNLFFFEDCDSFIGSFSSIATTTKGRVSSVRLDNIKKGVDAAMKRENLGYDVEFTYKHPKGIELDKGVNSMHIVSSSEAIPIRYTVTNPDVIIKMPSLKVQVIMKYKAPNGSEMKAVIEGSIDLVETIGSQNVKVVISTTLNVISQLVEKNKFTEALDELNKLKTFKFNISADEDEMFKQTLPCLESFIEQGKSGEIPKDEVVAVLNNMKSIKPSDISTK